MFPAIPTVAALAEQIRAGSFDPAGAVRDALAKGRPDDAVAAVIAASAAERPLDAGVVAPLAPVVAELLAIPILFASSTGDKTGALLGLVEADSMTSDREAMALLLAAHIGFGRKTTQLARFHTLLRLVARRCSGGDDASLLRAAGAAAKDPSVGQVLRGIKDLADAEGDAFAKDVVDAYEHPRDLLPKETERWVATGYTVTRATPKPGRNDPCPCGSGKKYKKCCEGKPVAADGATGAGSTGYARAKDVLTPERVKALPIQDLAAVSLAEMDPSALVTAMRQFALYRRWEDAERALDDLLSRKVPDMDADGLREELILSALDAKQLEVAKRIRTKMEGPSDPVVAMRFELSSPTKHSVAHLDELLVESLRADATIGVDIAHGLLVTHPALGIFLARGAIDPRKPLDSEFLLDRIEEARDVLRLPPGDSWQSLYDDALDRDVIHHTAEAEATARGNELANEAEALRAQAKRASSRVAELESKLKEQERALQETSTKRATETPSDEEDRRRLRAKVDELKARIAEGNEERATLRKDLARRNEELATTATRERPAPEKESAPIPEEPGELASVPRELLLPRFAKAAESTLRAMPSRVARDAFETIGALATGEPSAWAEVKRLVRVAAPIYEGRIGIHYRVLFAVEAKALEVLDVVHRKDLRAAVDRFV